MEGGGGAEVGLWGAPGEGRWSARTSGTARGRHSLSSPGVFSESKSSREGTTRGPGGREGKVESVTAITKIQNPRNKRHDSDKKADKEE